MAPVAPAIACTDPTFDQRSGIPFHRDRRGCRNLTRKRSRAQSVSSTRPGNPIDTFVAHAVKLKNFTHVVPVRVGLTWRASKQTMTFSYALMLQYEARRVWPWLHISVQLT